MPDPIKPKVPDVEPIIELVEHIPMAYLLLAFVAGIGIMFAAVMIYGTHGIGEDIDNAG